MKRRSPRALAVLLLCSLLPAQEPDAATGSSTWRIRARVLDAEGQPLAAAGLAIGRVDEVTTSAALTRPDARCGNDGALDCELSVPSGVLTTTVLLIAAPGKVAFRVPNPTRQRPGERSDTDVLDLGEIRLPDGHNLSGRVRDAAGKPIAGARIRAIDGLATYPWVVSSYGSQAITNERGVFLLPGVFANAMVVDVRADGYYDRHFPWASLGSPLDVQLEASGFVEGTVLGADGKPRECVVAASSEFIGTEYHFVRTQHGRFRLPVGKPCRFKVNAFVDGWNVVAESKLLHGPTTDVELRCETDDSQSFLVRAIDAATEEPVTAIRASVLWFGGDLDANIETILQWQLRRADGDGKVRLVPASDDPEKGVICVLAEGHAPFYQQHVESKRGEPCVARLVRESRIEGRIVDAATGQPVAGITVTCERKERRARNAGDPSTRPFSTQTAADGSFAIGGLGPGKHVVVARHALGTANVTKLVELQAATVERDLTLELPVGVTLTGKITGIDAARGWQMLLASGDVEPAARMFRTGGDLLEAWNAAGAVPIVDGAFRFEQRAPGTEQLFLVVPMAPRHGAALRIPVAKVTIGDEDVALDVDLTAHLPGSVEGKLTVTGAEIPFGRLAVVATQLVENDTPWVDHREQIRRRHWSLASGDGHFAIAVAPGSYSIEVIDVATGVALLAPSEPIEVVAGRRRERNLTVVAAAMKIRFDSEPEGHLPVHRLRVLLGDEQPYSGQITLFGGGSWGNPGFDLVGVDRDAPFFVPPGTVRLQVHGGATRIARGSVSFGGGDAEERVFEAAAGKVETVTLKLPAPTTIEEK